jgi:hypothetical protein
MLYFPYPKRLLAAAGVLLSIVAGQAQITLQDGNSTAYLDPTTQAGMYYWAVQHTPTLMQNELNQQWFWYRVGNSGPEASIDTLSSLAVTQPSANSVTTTWLDPLGRFNLKITYTLQGGAFSSGAADIAEQITVNNTSGAILPYHFFQYSDFNMAGDPGNDAVVLTRNPFTSRWVQSDQFDGSYAAEIVTTPNANHAEADTVPNTLNKLNDLLPSTLDDSKTNAAGDVAWAFEWDVNIAAGGSLVISKDKNVSIPFIPEPSSAALLITGVTALIWRTRRNRK